MRPEQEISIGGDWPDRLRTLLRAAIELSAPHERDDVLQEIVHSAAAVAGARFAALGIYGDTDRLTTFVHHGIDAATVEAIGEYPHGRGLLGEVIVADAPVRLADLSADPRSVGFPPGHPQMRTFLGVPILRAGRRYGNLYLTEKAGGAAFDDTDEALATALAAFAAGAIETAELLASERSRAAAEEQARARRELLAQVIAAQEAERARVSRDLHDDVGQALTSVLLGLRLVEDSLDRPDVDVEGARSRVAELRELVADGLRRARELAFDLRPTVLDDVGLTAALHRLTEDVAARSGLTIELDAAALAPDERLSPEVETVIYRVVQEALTNVVRHASAAAASVTFAGRNGVIRVFVEDDGRGFDPQEVPTRAHLGIEGMLERAGLVGGTVSVTSVVGAGTTIVLEVPRG
ncbi:MAG: GAF domain-containing sensor histidine kinase [Acidimicrobiia bacterium]